MWYRNTKEIKNWVKTQFKAVGRYDIPMIEGMPEVEPPSFIGFNYAKSIKDKDGLSCHFYLDDYQFNRVWDKPEENIELLKGFKYVLSPDFSLFMDYPQAIQIYNHYRKHWCGAYWQGYGIKVIPTISWSDERSFEWCFDGEPRNSVVSVSTVGVMNSGKAKKAFEKGFDKMMEILEPSQVIVYGIKFDGLGCLADDRVIKIHNRRFK